VFNISIQRTPVKVVVTLAFATGVLIFSAVSGTGAASAALVSSGSCPAVTVSHPFASWGDSSSYELVPGGNFEGSLAGWSLAGGATRTAGSEPYGVTGTVGQSSLLLPAGASAQSPPVCVDASHPTFRFFAATTACSRASRCRWYTRRCSDQWRCRWAPRPSAPGGSPRCPCLPARSPAHCSRAERPSCRFASPPC